MSTKTKEVSTQVVLESLRKKSAPLIKKLEGVTVATNDEYGAVTAHLKQLKEYGKEADRQLKTITDPLKLAAANAKKIFQPFFDRLDAIEVETKKQLKVFVDRQEQLAAKTMQDFDEGKIKKVGTVLAKQAELAVSSESASVRKVTKLKCIDADLTPRQYLMPNEAAIMAALKEGKKVKGWELEKVNSIAV